MFFCFKVSLSLMFSFSLFPILSSNPAINSLYYPIRPSLILSLKTLISSVFSANKAFISILQFLIIYHIYEVLSSLIFQLIHRFPLEDLSFCLKILESIDSLFLTIFSNRTSKLNFLGFFEHKNLIFSGFSPLKVP